MFPFVRFIRHQITFLPETPKTNILEGTFFALLDPLIWHHSLQIEYLTGADKRSPTSSRSLQYEVFGHHSKTPIKSKPFYGSFAVVDLVLKISLSGGEHCLRLLRTMLF